MNKQQVIYLVFNRNNFPSVISDIICSFCFYDVKTGETINFIKIKKSEILNKFELAYCSRKYPTKFLPHEDADSCEHWLIDLNYFMNSIETIEKQFQGINCTQCGNYKNSQIFDLLSHNTKCIC